MVCFSLCFDGRLNDFNEILWKFRFVIFYTFGVKTLYIYNPIYITLYIYIYKYIYIKYIYIYIYIYHENMKILSKPAQYIMEGGGGGGGRTQRKTLRHVKYPKILQDPARSTHFSRHSPDGNSKLYIFIIDYEKYIKYPWKNAFDERNSFLKLIMQALTHRSKLSFPLSQDLQ